MDVCKGKMKNGRRDIDELEWRCLCVGLQATYIEVNYIFVLNSLARVEIDHKNTVLWVNEANYLLSQKIFPYLLQILLLMSCLFICLLEVIMPAKW